MGATGFFFHDVKSWRNLMASPLNFKTKCYMVPAAGSVCCVNVWECSDSAVDFTRGAPIELFHPLYDLTSDNCLSTTYSACCYIISRTKKDIYGLN